MLGDSIPVEFSVEKKAKPWEIVTDEFSTKRNSSDDISTANLRQLYKLLLYKKYYF